MLFSALDIALIIRAIRQVLNCGNEIARSLKRGMGVLMIGPIGKV
jgi:hypothetical protein